MTRYEKTLGRLTGRLLGANLRNMGRDRGARVRARIAAVLMAALLGSEGHRAMSPGSFRALVGGINAVARTLRADRDRGESRYAAALAARS